MSALIVPDFPLYFLRFLLCQEESMCLKVKQPRIYKFIRVFMNLFYVFLCLSIYVFIDLIFLLYLYQSYRQNLRKNSQVLVSHSWIPSLPHSVTQSNGFLRGNPVLDLKHLRHKMRKASVNRVNSFLLRFVNNSNSWMEMYKEL